MQRVGVAAKSYTPVQVGLHWTIALLVLFQLVFGESMSEVVEAADEGEAASGSDQWLASAHYWVVIAVLALVGLRIVFRLVHDAPAPGGEKGLTSMLATAAHAAFYLLLVAVPVIGLLGFYLGDPWGELHALAKPAFIVLIGAHVAGAVFHQFVLKDGTLRRMTLGRSA